MTLTLQNKPKGKTAMP